MQKKIVACLLEQEFLLRLQTTWCVRCDRPDFAFPVWSSSEASPWMLRNCHSLGCNRMNKSCHLQKKRLCCWRKLKCWKRAGTWSSSKIYLGVLLKPLAPDPGSYDGGTQAILLKGAHNFQAVLSHDLQNPQRFTNVYRTMESQHVFIEC